MGAFKIKTFGTIVAIVALVVGSQTSANSDLVANKFNRRTFLSDFKIQKENQVKVAFLDADSTLRVSLSGSVSANAATDVSILPNVATRLAELVEQGYLLMVVSNQGGVAAGAVTLEVADGALKYMIEQIKLRNPKAAIHYYDFAETKNEFRKPETGMARELERRLKKSYGATVDYSKSIMIGDSVYKKDLDLRPDGTPGTHFSNADRGFAENLGIEIIEAAVFFGWRSNGIDVFESVEQVRQYCSRQTCLK